MNDMSKYAKGWAGLVSALSIVLMLVMRAAASNAEEGPGAASVVESQQSASADVTPSSEQIEKDLQRLPWAQFKSVLSAIPKLKADVDAFGPFGWQLVQANYRSYGWKRSIDKLDDSQKKQLAELLQKAKSTVDEPASNGG